jgi:hypothetical protein
MQDEELRALFGSSAATTGWGQHQTVEVGQSKVFVKRVPVTHTELDSAFSTRNLYNLPVFYNYGVGSAGFGVFRELATHVKTTNWVLEGAIAHFPLMYHHRIMRRSDPPEEVDAKRLRGYVEYWGGDENIGRYWLDRAAAQHELVLLLEHLPHTLLPWLPEHAEQVEPVVRDLRATIDFLRQHGIIHFDAHFFNILTDGDRPYLTDFGLALDRTFELTEEEALFFEQHTHYDYGEILWSLGYLLMFMYNALSDGEKQEILKLLGTSAPTMQRDTLKLLVHNIERLSSVTSLVLHTELVAAVVRYRGVITFMQDFYSELRANPKKDAPFPHTELRRMLNAVGVAT